MKQINIILLLGVSLIGILVGSNITVEANQNISSNKIVEFSNDYTWDISNIELKYLNMSNTLIVKFIEKTDIDYDLIPEGNLPYTYYNVKILGHVKGNIDKKEITLAIPGGYDKEGYFYGYNLENYEDPVDYLPNKNEVYMISFNYTTEINSVDNIYRVSIPEYLIPMSNYNENKSVHNQSDLIINELIYENETGLVFINDSIDMINDESIMIFAGDPGGGGPTGDSFDTAITLYDNTTTTSYIGVGQEKYYKYNSNDSYNTIVQTIYHDSDLDTYGYLYDSNKNLIDVDNDHGDGRNFLVENWNRNSTTYYIKVRAFSLSQSGYYKILAGKDPECSCINDTSDLTYPSYRNSVDSNNRIDYRFIPNNSNFENYTRYENLFNNATENWNSLGYVNISETTSVFPDLEVHLISYDNYVAGRYYYYEFLPDIIELNIFNLVDDTDDEVESHALHELGHALGIKHMHVGDQSTLTVPELTTNVMSYSAAHDLIVLGPCEKNIYYKLWK